MNVSQRTMTPIRPTIALAPMTFEIVILSRRLTTQNNGTPIVLVNR